MRACVPRRAPSALYDRTGMPCPSAFLIGPSKALLSVTAMARPAALALMAALVALTILPTSAFWSPVHWKSQLTRAQASSAPYCVGTKNGFVVTWLMNTNFHLGWLG